MRRDSYNFLLLLFAIRIYIFRLDTRKKKDYKNLSKRTDYLREDQSLTLDLTPSKSYSYTNNLLQIIPRYYHNVSLTKQKEKQEKRKRNRKKLPKLSHNPTLSLVSRSILLFHGARNNLAPPPSFVPNLLSFYPTLVSLSLSPVPSISSRVITLSSISSSTSTSPPLFLSPSPIPVSR